MCKYLAYWHARRNHEKKKKKCPSPWWRPMRSEELCMYSIVKVKGWKLWNSLSKDQIYSNISDHKDRFMVECCDVISGRSSRSPGVRVGSLQVLWFLLESKAVSLIDLLSRVYSCRAPSDPWRGVQIHSSLEYCSIITMLLCTKRDSLRIFPRLEIHLKSSDLKPTEEPDLLTQYQHLICH